MSLNQPYIREESWELCSTSSDHSSEISPTAEKTESRVCIMMRYTFHVDIKVCQLTISLTVTWFISMTSAIMFSSMLTICKFVSVCFPLETMVWSFMTVVTIGCQLVESTDRKCLVTHTNKGNAYRVKDSQGCYGSSESNK